jgi:putative ABC transport system permease protein
MGAASAIAAGSAPATSGGSRQARLAGAIPLPRSLTLGIGESLAKPIRSAMTVVAIVIGVATVTFASGLHQSLGLVASALTHDKQIQVQVYRSGETKKGGPSGPTDEDTTALIAGQPGTARYVSIGHANASVPGAGETVPVWAYRGDSSWLGFVMIHGRWFSAPGEAVAPTAFFARTGHRVGDTITADFYGTPVQLRLIGEIFDQQGDDILLRTSFDSVPGKTVAWDYDVQLRPGTDPVQYASAIESSSPGLSARLNRENGADAAFLLINSVLAGLALVLGLIAASGVFNTVVLNTREKARDFAILKAVGMTPRQVITMVLASVAVLGLIGAAAGIPSGIGLHRYILAVMGQIATSTGIPDVFFNVFGVQVIAVLAATGVVIAMVGALLPARWAARSRIADVLQAE